MKLPNDYNGWMSLLTKIIGGIVALGALAHPGFHVPAATSTWVPAVATGIVGLEQIAHSWGHHSVKKTLAQTGKLAEDVVHAAPASSAAPASPSPA